MNLFFRMMWLRLRRRARGPLSVWDTAVTPFRVWPSDLDTLWHMNNGRYLSIMDLGRLDLMTRSGTHQAFMKRGWYPVVAGQTIAYYRSLNPWKTFEIHTRVLGVEAAWVYVTQDFVRNGDLMARAFLRTRFLKRAGGSVTHAELVDFIGGVPDDRVIPEWLTEWSRHAKPSG